jgi:glycosyltransferase involved in cell wall biosynthesis
LKKEVITIGLFSHVEAYPPTLNAIRCLAAIYEEVIVICSNVFISDWDYPKNVKLVVVGKYFPIREFEQQSIFFKIKHFAKFTLQIRKYLKKSTIFLACDAIPLWAYKVASIGITQKKLWYHNHDVTQPGLNRKYSIGWFAEKNEPKIFPSIDIFTLPSEDRKKYFPMDEMNGHYYFLPNYPSKYFYSLFNKNREVYTNKVRIIYQGSIGEGHGIEEIIMLLNEKVNNATLQLVLKGFISDKYKEQLIALAKEHKTNDRLIFEGVTSYKIVPKLACTCNIGIAIHSKMDRMNSTLGTASNKIYEYAACGLPVLYFDSPYYNSYLQKYEWAFPVVLSKASLLNAITTIEKNFDKLSQKAIKDFEENLNFEIHFNYLKNDILTN